MGEQRAAYRHRELGPLHKPCPFTISFAMGERQLGKLWDTSDQLVNLVNLCK